MIFLIILIALFLSNIPWFSNNLFIIFPLKNPKSIVLVFFEIIINYFIVGFFVIFIEKQVIGNIHPQGWEFYVVTFFLFIVLSSPGFIYKVIWK
tara:strand:- start:16510 stop:16791 length:282 start_codon:yes stop_codon:yes gene_type:complete